MFAQEPYENFVATLPEFECRYGVYDYDYTDKEGCQKSKIVFFAWCVWGAPLLRPSAGPTVARAHTKYKFPSPTEREPSQRQDHGRGRGCRHRDFPHRYHPPRHNLQVSITPPEGKEGLRPLHGTDQRRCDAVAPAPARPPPAFRARISPLSKNLRGAHLFEDACASTVRVVATRLRGSAVITLFERSSLQPLRGPVRALWRDDDPLA